MDWIRNTLLAIGSFFGGFTNWWNTLNLGNLSEAFAAVGAVLVLAWTVRTSLREIRRNRIAEGVAEIEAERRAAALAVARVAPVSLGLRSDRATIFNDSGYPIYGVKLVIPNDPKVPLDGRVKYEDAKAYRINGVIPVGKRLGKNIPIARPAGEGFANIHVRFKDVEGINWRLGRNARLFRIEDRAQGSADFDMRIDKLRWENRELSVKLWDWVCRRKLGSAEDVATPPSADQPHMPSENATEAESGGGRQTG